MEGPPIGPSSSSCHVVAGRICAWIRSRVELPSSATAAGVAVLGWSKRGGWLISRVGEGEAISRIRSWSIIARSRIEVKKIRRASKSISLHSIVYPNYKVTFFFATTTRSNPTVSSGPPTLMPCSCGIRENEASASITLLRSWWTR